MRKLLNWPRRWHAWLAIALLLPFLIIAVTGVLFAHGPSLGFREIRVPVGWLPGYGESGGPVLRSAAPSGGVWWVLAPQGVVRVENGVAQVVPALAQEDIRSLVVTPQGVLGVSQQGLWKETQGEWEKILKGPVLQANGDAQTLTAMLRGKGPQVSRDGGASWEPLQSALAPALAALPKSDAPTEVTLAQLVHDLHTGKALFTGKAEWVWQDVMGLTLLFLACSGFYMWWSKRRATRRAAVAAEQAAEA
ncbi:MAG: hypothetical protein K0S16_798 [Moraxellaceae bacterium]|jgi:hypothetical protein|nr:hypothetical protein [Moraxellaceae bacterium]